LYAARIVAEPGAFQYLRSFFDAYETLAFIGMGKRVGFLDDL
jgi:hypothetical protein